MIRGLIRRFVPTESISYNICTVRYVCIYRHTECKFNDKQPDSSLVLWMSQIPSCDGHRLNIYEYMVESLSYPTVPVLEVETWRVTSFRQERKI